MTPLTQRSERVCFLSPHFDKMFLAEPLPCVQVCVRKHTLNQHLRMLEVELMNTKLDQAKASSPEPNLRLPKQRRDYMPFCAKVNVWL